MLNLAPIHPALDTAGSGQAIDVSGSGHAVVVVEPSEVVRLGCVMMLRELDHISRVTALGRADDPATLLSRTDPDMVLVSCALKPSDLDLIQAQAARQGVKVLLLLHSVDDPRLSDFAQRFTDGLILVEDLTVEYLRDALSMLDRGREVMLPARLTRRLLQQPPSRLEAGYWHRSSLTQRELDVLTLVAQGLSNKQIAPRMGISEHGVKRHVANILAKLNCSNRTHAVSYAIRLRILPDSTTSAD